jgi:hypothetical protein
MYTPEFLDFCIHDYTKCQLFQITTVLNGVFLSTNLDSKECYSTLPSDPEIINVLSKRSRYVSVSSQCRMDSILFPVGAKTVL